jgi:hypothetical protein
MKSWERIFITLALCLTMLAAVWLHGLLNRYAVVSQSQANNADTSIKFDRFSGKMWIVTSHVASMSDLIDQQFASDEPATLKKSTNRIIEVQEVK